MISPLFGTGILGSLGTGLQVLCVSTAPRPGRRSTANPYDPFEKLIIIIIYSESESLIGAKTRKKNKEMKPGAIVAGAALCAAIPLVARSPAKLATLAGAALASYLWLKPPQPIVDEEELPPERRGICTDRYSDSKVPENLDAIVIGSGMSGLTCAAILARMGKRVLVLEQHDRTGGGTHTYDLGPDNFTFDSGLHYSVPESALLLQLCTGTEKVPVDFDLMGIPNKDGNFQPEHRAMFPLHA
jgi:hypothetical protein